MSRRAETAPGVGPAAQELVNRFRRFPCGAAVKAPAQLEAALASRCGAIFVLRANGLELSPVVQRIHLAGKLAVVHLDLVDGLSADLAGAAGSDFNTHGWCALPRST